MKMVTQEQQVIEVLRRAGGYATLRRLNELVDFSTSTHWNRILLCSKEGFERVVDLY